MPLRDCSLGPKPGSKEARGSVASLTYTNTHIYTHGFKRCPSGYSDDRGCGGGLSRLFRRRCRDREVGDPLMAGRERGPTRGPPPDTYARPKSRTRTGTVDRSCALPTLGRLPASRGGWFLLHSTMPRPFPPEDVDYPFIRAHVSFSSSRFLIRRLRDHDPRKPCTKRSAQRFMDEEGKLPPCWFRLLGYLR